MASQADKKDLIYLNNATLLFDKPSVDDWESDKLITFEKKKILPWKH